MDDNALFMAIEDRMISELKSREWDFDRLMTEMDDLGLTSLLSLALTGSVSRAEIIDLLARVHRRTRAVS